MLAAAGVGHGDRVGILLDNDGAVEAHVAYHASHLLGAINVPLNTRYVARELEYVLGFIEPAAVVFAPAVRRRCWRRLRAIARRRRAARGGARPVWARRGRAARRRRAVAARRRSTDDDADWIFTSGTTGNPKAVALTHRGSVACGYQAVGAGA